MLNKYLITFLSLTFGCFFVQCGNAQSMPSGEVISLNPDDGEIVCSCFSKAKATGRVLNGYPDRGIRGKIKIQIIRRVSNGIWEFVPPGDEQIKLIDVGGVAALEAECGGDLPNGIYAAKVWLQWQPLPNDPDTGHWFTLKSPAPRFGGLDSDQTFDENTYHLFVVGPCPPSEPKGTVKSK